MGLLAVRRERGDVSANRARRGAAPKNVAGAVADAAKFLQILIDEMVDFGKKDEEVFVDPNDPMKFFTESNKPEDDYLTYALFVAALWLVFEGLKATQTLR